MVFQGTLQELISKQNQSSKLVIETSNVNHSVDIIRSMQLNGIIDNGKVILPILSRETIAKLNRRLTENGIDVFEMSVIKKDLETIFMELIKI
jgi:uncharacterized protein YbaP (TraB family)